MQQLLKFTNPPHTVIAKLIRWDALISAFHSNIGAHDNSTIFLYIKQILVRFSRCETVMLYCEM